jgi:hypothetical protein
MNNLFEGIKNNSGKIIKGAVIVLGIVAGLVVTGLVMNNAGDGPETDYEIVESDQEASEPEAE